METLCCIFGPQSGCTAVAEAFGEDAAGEERFCTKSEREAYLREEFPNNFTSCEGNCSGALEAMQEWFFISLDHPSFSEMNSQGGLSRRHIARLREYTCANAAVLTCAATPDGAGYETCRSTSDGTTTTAPASAPADPADVVNMLATCDVALAVKVAMKFTVEDPAAFVADNANKLAVEAGIAAAASTSSQQVQATDVEATLTVARRRLKESLRRLTGGNVDIDATIYTDDAAAATTMVDTVAAIETTALSAAIETAFEDAGINVTALGLTVQEIAAPAVQSADEANEEAASPPGSGGNSGTAASGAHQASVAAGVLGILAVFAATTTM